jgi:acylphosphatase
VRNLGDGRVEMVVEGEEDQIDAYVGAIDDHFGRMIHERHAIPESPEGLGEFRITRE